MPEQRIGECSLCGGDVMGHVGAWWSTEPPPPPECTTCGAVSEFHSPVIPMRPKRPFKQPPMRRFSGGMG